MKRTPFFAFLLIIALLSCKKKKEEVNDVVPIVANSEEKQAETDKRVITDSSTEEQDKKLLSELSSEIYALSESVPCANSTQWKTAGMGMKPCGGILSYVPYSVRINETDFLNKVKHFNQQNLKYISKSRIVSDCAVDSPPNRVKCVNNKAVVY